MAVPIAVVDNQQAGRFEVHLDGATAFAEYRLEPGRIVLPHTVVPEQFEGRGVASALAKAALAHARERGLKVVPTCAFMSAYITRHAEYHDLVDPECRAHLGLS